MVVLKPDYVLVQFGLIDEFGELETQKTTIPEYTENLRTIVQIVREFDGTPILVTPPVQRYFDARDKVIRVYPDRRAAILSLAAELGTWVIDLNQLTAELFDRLGSEGGAYIWYADNYLHFSDEGARVIAGLVVRALPASLGPYLVNVFD